MSPANAVSRHMVLREGFVKVGEEMDDEDGLEEVFELRLPQEVASTTERFAGSKNGCTGQR